MWSECEVYKSFFERDQKQIEQLQKELETANKLSDYLKNQNEKLIMISLNISEKITIVNNY